MKNIWAGVLTALTCIAVQAWSAEANVLTPRQSIRINAPPEAVWAVVGDFNGSPRWLPLVERSEDGQGLAFIAHKRYARGR